MTWKVWYDSLIKPAWTPEPATIGLMWQIIYPIILVTFGFVFVQAIRKKVPWMVVAIWRHYKWVAVAQIPYFAWVSIASVLHTVDHVLELGQMILRLSHKLNTKIKAGKLTEMPLDENPYVDWSSHLFAADRTQYIILMNTASTNGKGEQHNFCIFEVGEPCRPR